MTSVRVKDSTAFLIEYAFSILITCWAHFPQFGIIYAMDYGTVRVRTNPNNARGWVAQCLYLRSVVSEQCLHINYLTPTLNLNVTVWRAVRRTCYTIHSNCHRTTGDNRNELYCVRVTIQFPNFCPLKFSTYIVSLTCLISCWDGHCSNINSIKTMIIHEHVSTVYKEKYIVCFGGAIISLRRGTEKK